MNNEVPLTSTELQEKLPGVGRYTAGAVASIAFGERAAAVDGNVIRVLSRVRCVGADYSLKVQVLKIVSFSSKLLFLNSCTPVEIVLNMNQVVIEHIWNLSEQLVPASEPGNFNQAMMDLGATICTPKKPSCKTCPVSQFCLAYQRVQRTYPLKELQSESTKPVIDDIENGRVFISQFKRMKN